MLCELVLVDAPAAPSTLSAAGGVGQVTLSWSAATRATSYNVYEGTASGGKSPVAVATGISATGFTVLGLLDGSRYYFTVAGVNSSGVGPASKEATALTVAASPTGLTAEPANDAAVLKWTASTGATSYNVYAGGTSGGEAATPIATGLTGPFFIQTGLTNGDTYYYEVTAVNGSGESGKSTEASATPIPVPCRRKG